MTKIAEIEERLSRATPGPWEWGHHWDGVDWIRNGEGGRKFRPASDTSYEWLPSSEDAQFIAACPSDVAYLLDLLGRHQRALQFVCDELSMADAFDRPVDDERIMKVIHAEMEGVEE